MTMGHGVAYCLYLPQDLTGGGAVCVDSLPLQLELLSCAGYETLIEAVGQTQSAEDIVGFGGCLDDGGMVSVVVAAIHLAVRAIGGGHCGVRDAGEHVIR